MSEHQFACGERVFLTRQLFLRNQADTMYEIVGLLPSDGSFPRYRVKAAHESFSRVALEHTMTAVEAAPSTAVVLDFPAAIGAFAVAKPLRLPEPTE